jgi:cell fate (sporulation/competence/biofilm development) regulator YlbF (YheA/YmcA/DUF963 family)
MSMLAEDSALMTKTKELCAQIVAEPRYQELQQTVERFLDDDAARLQYQSVHERGEELHHKQHAGVELGSAEVREFEAARDALFKNEVARGFLEAQRELEMIQQIVGKYVGMTLELGRVPSSDDFAEADSGCCGGNGGGGCGCSH